jgi:hypothetical protein
MKDEMETKVNADKLPSKPTLMGVCLVVAIGIFSLGMYASVKTGVEGFLTYKSTAIGGISATGSATKDFLSNLATWSGSFTARGGSTQEAYATIKEHSDIVKQYLLDNGVEEDEFSFRAVDISQQYVSEYNDEGMYIGDRFDGYLLTQRIDISSSDVDKVQTLSRSITQLIDDGVDFKPESPAYYYTKLDELKLEMIEQATQNAKQRVDILAKNADSEAGRLLNANLGVFQIMARNSSSEEFSASGAFNTSSKWKTASITVRLYYAIE